MIFELRFIARRDVVSGQYKKILQFRNVLAWDERIGIQSDLAECARDAEKWQDVPFENYPEDE